MDSERRHQLSQNALGNWIFSQYNGWIKPNSNWLGWAVIGVLAVILIAMATVRVSAWNQAAAWKQYYAALHSGQSEADLEALADSTTGVVGIHARLALAQQKLDEACNTVFTDKAKAIAALEKAVFVFQKVQKSTTNQPALQQAGFGLAQSWETLACARKGDDLNKAVEEYKKIAERWKDSFVGKRAAKQLEIIERPNTQKFLELAAAQVTQPESKDDFKVEIDTKDPFAAPGSVDVDKALEGGTKK
ncbi:hypothetical protein FACS189454_08160 [Planctomycetales bacterium]|nr:hypothetical protein FACS189454_08160 [Planctomycetales bacterium]